MNTQLNFRGKTIFHISLWTVLWVTCISCSGLNVLQEGQQLYTGADIVVKDSLPEQQINNLEEGLKTLITPKPNKTFLGMRPKLFFYHLAGTPKKEKGLKHWMKTKLGEPPVLLSDVDTKFNERLLVNYAQNKGYFNAEALSEIKSKGKTAKVAYTIYPGSQYTISQVRFPQGSTLLDAEINKLKAKSLLKVGEPFDLETIKQERDRIDARLKEKGYYYFSPDNIIVQADSTVTNKHNVELIVKLKESTPRLAKKPWTIDKVVVFPNYNLKQVRTQGFSLPIATDTIKPYKGFYIIDPEHRFKPSIFDRVLYFEPGDLYNRSDHNLSLKRLINLGVFKYVKNEFIVSDSLNHRFDAYYLLTPGKIQSLGLETLGKTNSANFAGAELNLNWTHRNIFHGAEQLKINAYGGFDVQIGGRRTNSNLYTLGLKGELAIPRIVAPFKFNPSSAFLPRTVASLGYQFQRRTEQYTLHNFTGAFGYHWRENERKEHQLNILKVSVVAPQNVTAEFQAKADSIPSLKRMIERQLIFGPTYTYTYTNTMLPKKSTFYYQGRAQLAGTFAGLFSGANAKKGRQKNLFGIPFSQFIKMEHDFRWYYKLGKKQSLATRLIFGIAYPYGNSTTIPFTEQFFAGGSNSIRAFKARTLGPGSFDPRNLSPTLLYDESGDVKLEFNLEYRANIYSFLNFAAFIDAGNVWLINDDPHKPGGRFSGDFYKEIAVGAGVGLRFDFSIFVLRLDLAMPLRIPYYPEGDRWTFDEIDFGNPEWRRNNLVLNIAIGYPF